MPANRVSAQLGEAKQQGVFAAIQTIRQKLPFLVDLTPEERRALPRFGDAVAGGRMPPGRAGRLGPPATAGGSDPVASAHICKLL